MNLLQMRARAERAGIAIDGKMWKVMLRHPAQGVAAIRAVLKDYLGVRRPAPTTGRSGAALTRTRTTTRTKKGKRAMAAMNLRSIERRISKLEGRSHDDAPVIHDDADPKLVESIARHGGLVGDAARAEHARLALERHERTVDGARLQEADPAERFELQAAASAGMTLAEYRKATRGAR